MSSLRWSHFGRFAGLAQLLLFSLEDGPKHAQELWNELAQARDLWLEPGTLYRALRHLEQRGWIEPFGDEQVVRPYRLTERGIAVIAQFHASQAEKRDHIGWHPSSCRQKERMMKLVTWILRLYPKAWRERYEDEMRMLLEEHEITLFTWLDLLLGALDARRDPYYRTTRPLSPLQRLQRMRTAAASAFCALPLFIFFYYTLILDQVDGPWDSLRQAQQPIIVLASTLGALAGMIWGVTMLAAVLVLVSGSLSKSTTNEEKWLGLLPLCGGLVAGAALASHFLFPWPWLNMIQFGVFFLGMLSVPASIALAITRSKIAERPLRTLLILGALTSIGLAIYQLSLMLEQVVTSFLWPGGNWSLQLIVGLLLMMLPTVVAFWLLIRNWIALPPSLPSAPQASILPLQSKRQTQ